MLRHSDVDTGKVKIEVPLFPMLPHRLKGGNMLPLLVSDAATGAG